MTSLRIGQGYDVHRLVAGRDLILGGVKIPHTTGLDGHSDADVLVHAIMDSLLGAASLGDIGKIFPDTDLEYKNISSIILLEKVVLLLEENCYKIINIDSTIVAQSPKLADYIPKMCNNISEISKSPVNVKATTEENLGFTGQKLGISAQAISLICKTST
jgi:2-C-methyl-D-erythritol 2,4-cyclodiphosphate synthase